ncbi:hypothetical protein HDU91_000896, partial [Kappamyces sp. JEL0680]
MQKPRGRPSGPATEATRSEKAGGLGKIGKAVPLKPKEAEIPLSHNRTKSKKPKTVADNHLRSKSEPPGKPVVQFKETRPPASDGHKKPEGKLASAKEPLGAKHSAAVLKTIRLKGSGIPLAKKAPARSMMKKIDSSLQQLRVFRTKLKHELAHSLNQTKTSKYLVEDKVLDLDGVDFGDETAVREKLTELFHSQLAAKSANAELLASVQLLQSKLAREQEKGRLHPKVTSVVPTSLEANMHLRYQYQKNLEKERKKYTALLLENEKLALEVKEAALAHIKKRKVENIETQSSHLNEIAGWKGKVRELELDNLQLLEIITKREQALAKVVKEKEYIYNEMVTMRRLHMHLSNRIDMADTESDQAIPSLKAMEEKASSDQPAAAKDESVPHYASKVNRANDIVVRKGNAARLQKLVDGAKETTIHSGAPQKAPANPKTR